MILRYDAYIHGMDSLRGQIEAIAYDSESLKGSVSEAIQVRNELIQADALFIRTVTKITQIEFPELALPENRVRFIGTASAGKDHVDETWLKSLGIEFSYAPGCNARAVAEYVISAILIWLSTENRTQDRPLVGIFGAGHTGSATANLLKNLGFPVVLYDPPKERRDPSFKSCLLEEFQEAEIWSLHVPLLHSGQDPTYHLIDESMITNSPPQLLIQASRGGVVDERILWGLDRPDWICDVWEHEPNPDLRSLHRAKIATPHIAGYSVEAKARALKQIIGAFATFSNLQITLLDNINLLDYNGLNFSSTPLPGTLGEAISELHPILNYHQVFKKERTGAGHSISSEFLKVRNETPLRHELSALKCPKSWHDRYPELHLLGVGQE